MPWKLITEDRIEATAYTRDSSADSVFRELKSDGGENFAGSPSDLPGLYDDWKTYKITVIIEEV